MLLGGLSKISPTSSVMIAIADARGLLCIGSEICFRKLHNDLSPLELPRLHHSGNLARQSALLTGPTL